MRGAKSRQRISNLFNQDSLTIAISVGMTTPKWTDFIPAIQRMPATFHGPAREIRVCSSRHFMAFPRCNRPYLSKFCLINRP
jgi:hypothetical protein